MFMCARACVRPMYAGCRCGVVLNTALVLQVFGLTRKPRGKDERHTFNRSRSRDQLLGVLKNGLGFFGCQVYRAYYEGGHFWNLCNGAHPHTDDDFHDVASSQQP